MRTACLTVAALLTVAATLPAGDAPPRVPRPKPPTKPLPPEKLSDFPAAKHGRGDLRHEQGLSVVTLRGTPAEMGEQFGVLAVKAAPSLDEFHRNFVADAGIGPVEPLVRLLALKLQAGMSAAHLAELTAMAQASKRPIDLAMFANTVYDLSSTMGCSTVIAEGDRSSAGGPVFGRNFDWLPTRGMRAHTLIVAGHPAGKRSFALVTVPPILGCISGMNDAGLSCTVNEIHLPQAADKPQFQWDGVPMLFAFRRVLEECATVDEAATLLRGIKRTTTACLTVCDGKGGGGVRNHTEVGRSPACRKRHRAVHKPLPHLGPRQTDEVLALRRTGAAASRVRQTRCARNLRPARRGQSGPIHVAIDGFRAGRPDVAPESRCGAGKQANCPDVRHRKNARREVKRAKWGSRDGGVK